MIKPGQVLSVDIIDLASDGQGVAKHADGLVIFVPGVWPGERVKIRFEKLQGRVGRATLLEIESASTARRDAPCEYHGVHSGQCGGCPWMFADYAAQLAEKRRRVERDVSRIDPRITINRVISAENQLAYRNRCQLKSDGRQLGYLSAGSNTLVDVEQCSVLETNLQDNLKYLRQQLPNPIWRPNKKHKWVTLDLDSHMQPGEVSVNQRRAFQQANSQQNTQMREWLAQTLAKKNRSAKVLELFAGSGNLTDIILQAGFRESVAVECVPEAVTRLEALQASLKVELVDLFNEDAFSSLVQRHKDADILVLDPPRDGLKIKNNLFKRLKSLHSVIYVSCDLATFCRDLRDFTKNGFCVTDLCLLDMFPQTPHLEILCSLSR